MANPGCATVPLLSRMAGDKLFADGQGGAMLFKRTSEITLVHGRSELIEAIGKPELEIVIRRLFPGQIEVERKSFLKVFHALARLAGVQQPVADFSVGGGEVAPGLNVS